MPVETAQISENGRIVIPAAYRKAMGLKGNEIVTIRLDDDGLHIESRSQAIKRAQSVLKRYIPEDISLVDELIAERRREAKREQGSF